MAVPNHPIVGDKLPPSGGPRGVRTSLEFQPQPLSLHSPAHFWGVWPLGCLLPSETNHPPKAFP